MRVDWDTSQYEAISKFPIWHRGFWGGIKPLTTPLVFKIFNSQRTPIGIFFLIFSTLSWAFLALQVFLSLNNKLVKLAGLSMILLFSLIRNVAGWDGFLISESISFSLLAILVGFWLRIVQRWSPWNATALIVAGFFWVFARDTNAYLALMIAVPLGLAAILFKEQRRNLIISTALALFFFLSSLSSNTGQRWVLPVQHVLTFRIWRSKEDTAFFKTCQMPASPEMYEMVGELWIDEGWPLYDEFQAWLLDSGKSCYYHWLLSDTGRSIQEPLANLDQMMGYFKKEYAPQFKSLLPYRVEQLIYPYQRGLILVYLGYLGCGFWLRPKIWRENRAWLVATGMILLFLPHSVLVWHGDAADVDRHALTAGHQFYLGFWLMMLLAADMAIGYLPGLWEKLKKN